MYVQPHIRIDASEFRRTLAQYMRHTQRDLTDVLNWWGYEIAKEATKTTHKATVADIETDIGVVGRRIERTKGPNAKRPFKATARGEIYATGKGGAPVAALIINASRGRRGEKGLYGEDMRSAIRVVRNSRKRAIGSLRAGWLPAVVRLGRNVGISRFFKSTSKTSARLDSTGGALPAVVSWKPHVELWNGMVALVTRNEPGVARHLTRGLQSAVANVMAAKMRRLEQKLQQTANRYTRR